MDVTIECPCPPKATGEPRHAQDTVTLREKLDFRGATTVRNALAVVYVEDPAAGLPEVLATLTEYYIILGVESWTLADEKGKPVDVTKPAIREHLLSRPDTAAQIGDAADGLYADSILLPLLARAQRSSPPTLTNGSTSATTRSSPKRPRPSKPSSTTTIQTVATGTTSRSHAGGSNSSPSSRWVP